MTEDTIPEVFIIESLHPNDSKEGEIIEKILKMGGRSPQYRYVHTHAEFRAAINEFDEINYRYLHISSHGSPENFEFEFGDMYFNEFHGLIHLYLQNKRVFISACELVNHQDHALANFLLRDTGCYSLIGSYEPIRFDDAVMFWSSFYFFAYKAQTNNDDVKVSRSLILELLRKLTSLYQINMNYYSPSRSQGIKLAQYRKGKRVNL